MVEDGRELIEAQIILNSLRNKRRQEKQKPDFSPVDMDKVVPGFSEAINVDPLDGWHCCLFCHAEIKRLEKPDPLKRPGKFFRPLPQCKCVIEELDRLDEMKERQERKRRQERTYAKNIMSEAIANATFANWIKRTGTDKAHTAAVAFDKEFEGRSLGLLFTGDPGNGKSHLARAIQRSVDARGWVTLFLDWPQLVELAKATFGNSKTSVADIIRGAVDADLLVFDELGAGKLTDWEFKTLLFPILNGRAGKKTVATTNLNMDELEQWFRWDKDGIPIDEKGRLFDRVLGNFQIVKNNGTSKRREDALGRRKT